MEQTHSAFLAQYLQENFRESIPNQNLIQELSEAMLDGNIALKTDENLPNNNLFVKEDDGYIYSKRIFKTKNQIITQIKNLITTSSNIIDQESLNLSSQLNDLQKKACLVALQYNFSIITGGPGTGKTFTVSHILKNLIEHHSSLLPEEIIMVAPTGKAQARLKESLLNNGHHVFDSSQQDFVQKIASQTVTIHRLLGKYNNYVRYHEKHPIPYKVLIVDESSMIDLVLFQQLLNAVHPSYTKVILLGDQYQLPPVGLGAVFKDLCNSADLQNYRVELKESKRFHEESKIGQLAKAINEANIEDVFEKIYNNDQQNISEDETIWIVANDTDESFSQLDDWESLFKTQIITNVSEFNIQKNNFNALTQHAILCATNKGKEGVEFINNEIHQEIISRKKESQLEQIPFVNRQMVLVTSNQNDIGIFNGDIGIVSEDEHLVKYVYFPNGKRIKPQVIQKHQLGYALSIHKSQGSEYDHVLVLMSKANEKMLNRQLLYTAITRAKKLVVIKTTKTILKQTIIHNDLRITNIKNQF